MVKIEDLKDNSDLKILNKNLLFNFVSRVPGYDPHDADYIDVFVGLSISKYFKRRSQEFRRTSVSKERSVKTDVESKVTNSMKR